MIASVSKVECGIENLWMRGKSNGRSDYPKFGKHMSRIYFKAFSSAEPCYFADKKWLHVDKRGRMWGMILPCVTSTIKNKEIDQIYFISIRLTNVRVAS